jgi:hypothetical protein
MPGNSRKIRVGSARFVIPGVAGGSSQGSFPAPDGAWIVFGVSSKQGANGAFPAAHFTDNSEEPRSQNKTFVAAFVVTFVVAFAGLAFF